MIDIDWTKSMQRTYEFYKVNPETWCDEDKITTVLTCTINRDSSTNTLENATFDINNIVGEFYIRVYMIVFQNQRKYKVPMGTFLLQTPTVTYNGKVKGISADGYSPLIELDEKGPGPGYSILGSDILGSVTNIVEDNARAKIISGGRTIHNDSVFVSNDDDSWLDYTIELLASNNYQFGLTEMGEITLNPIVNIMDMQPRWVFNDDNSSILLPDISVNKDIYKIPNVLELVQSDSSGGRLVCIENNDPNSQLSIKSRGRKIVERIDVPDTYIGASESVLMDYAEKQLRDMSTIECTVSYSHGYCPVRVGDCVSLNYKRAGITVKKAKIQSQTIECSSSCTVTETASFSVKLWE